MKVSIIVNSNLKLNKLSYETFSVDSSDNSSDSVEVIPEEQNCNVSAKIAESKVKVGDFLLLFDIKITGKYKEEITRDFYMDIFYGYSIEDIHKLKLNNEEKKYVELNIFNYYQKKIEEIIKFNTSIGQVEALTIKDNIDAVQKEIDQFATKREVLFIES